MVHSISPCLWFDHQAEEAARFYVATFEGSALRRTLLYDEVSAQASGMPQGSVLTVEFELEGQQFVAMNGGPLYEFTPAISFMVDCATQEKVDRLWAALAEGGETMACGWLRDRFGVAWQIVPSGLQDMLSDPDPERAAGVMQAMLGMIKLDMHALREAYEVGPA